MVECAPDAVVFDDGFDSRRKKRSLKAQKVKANRKIEIQRIK